LKDSFFRTAFSPPHRRPVRMTFPSIPFFQQSLTQPSRPPTDFNLSMRPTLRTSDVSSGLTPLTEVLNLLQRLLDNPPLPVIPSKKLQSAISMVFSLLFEFYRTSFQGSETLPTSVKSSFFHLLTSAPYCSAFLSPLLSYPPTLPDLSNLLSGHIVFFCAGGMR